MGLRQKIADAATDPMNDPRLSLSDKALALAIGAQVEQATLRALRQHDAEKATQIGSVHGDATWRADGML